jgi:hypothetical protein
LPFARSSFSYSRAEESISLPGEEGYQPALRAAELGLATSLPIEATGTSPISTLHRTWDCEVPLVHDDVWRMLSNLVFDL